jgi:non-lysosomal glucosylceramidase
VIGQRLGNWYATQWPDAWSVVRYADENWRRLKEETTTFADTLFESTLPDAVLDAASANASILRTTTCLRTEDGRLHAFEGCSDNRGCCPMDCTHVWNYAWAVAHLFPQLERSVRLTDFQHNTRPNGDMAFRTLLPLLPDTLWAFKPAADGQMGTIVRAYREWLQCGDMEFLRAVWPGVVRALEFAWQPGSWDADKDGVMEGEQHNTYDIEFYGPNTMCGLFYLAALRAAGEMAKVLGESDRVAEYRRVFESGRRKYQELYNGEYFVQRVFLPQGAKDSHIIADTHPPSLQRGEAEPRYQYGPGCLADQVLGQWMAHNVGLGYLLPEEQIKSAVAAIHRHNFRPDLTGHPSVQRVYAVNDEAGLLLCTWPNGGRPRYPFPYADEVWTGIEYHVAAHLIYEGLVDDGLEIVEAVRSRHAGWNRNPWDEYECGHHYARAMSSWSLLLALSGYHYDAAAGHLAFDPKINAEDFRCFFSAGSGWGLFSQTRDGKGYRASLEVRRGTLKLHSLRLPLEIGAAVSVSDRAQSEVQVTHQGVPFVPPAVLTTGQRLTITASHMT